MRSLTGEKEAAGDAASHPGAGVDAHSTAPLARHRPSRTEEFIQQILPAARAVHEKYGIPISVVVAQGAWESGWGTKAPGNEYFGVKAHGWAGPTQGIRTTEFDAKGKHGETDSFRAYGSLAEAADDYGRFMTSQPRFRPAFEHTSDPPRFVDEIARARWGTDPNYAAHVNGIMKSHGLTRYDVAPHPEVQDAPADPSQKAASTQQSEVRLPHGGETLAAAPARASQVTPFEPRAYWLEQARLGRGATATEVGASSGVGVRQPPSGSADQTGAPTGPAPSGSGPAASTQDPARYWTALAALGVAAARVTQQAADAGQQAAPPRPSTAPTVRLGR